MIRVLVADDHPLVSDGIAAAIGADPTMEIIAVVDNGVEAVNYTKHYEPDVVLMDIDMPGKNGIEATADIQKSRPDIAVIGLSALDTGDEAARAVRAGAVGYLDKGLAAAELRTAVRRAHEGALIFSPDVAKRLMVWEVSDQSVIHQITARLNRGFRTTEHQRRVLAALVRGLSNKEIAMELNSTAGSVKTHVSRLKEKLNAGSRVELAMKAIRRGLVDPPYRSA
ncbi:response regulator transcription factor [Nesterenkonia ebinurensis]|uniref:response regulator transcription factor n=1 Tax=Nesterenkonia ebinurensis TaxID=2608252 RepID=UPI00123D9629|nr:response regulator transcription factor [Nesterenkonia ebinurensis]